MKFNHLTHNISLGLIALAILYVLLYSGITGLLIVSSVALITAAFVEQFELVVAFTILFTVFYTFVLKRFVQRLEPFVNSGKGIVNRLGNIQKNYHPRAQQLKNSRLEPYGVYEPSIEGFQSIQETKEGASQDSSFAPTSGTVNQVDEEEVEKITDAMEEEPHKKVEKEEFESATGSLFKMGKMPSEHTDGPKLDAGQTIMKAMKSFDTSTISSMTTDTKQLLETQKSLMGMLNTMRPVLAEGRELLQTFSGMFGGASAGGAGEFKL